MENRGEKESTFDLEVAPLPGFQAELIGPVKQLKLAANANRKVDLVLKVKPAPAAGTNLELKLVTRGRSLAATPLPVATE